MRRALDALCFSGAVCDRQDFPLDAKYATPPVNDVDAQLISCRVLIVLYVIDMSSWAVGKMALFEVFNIADQIGWATVKTALVMTSAEVLVEFVASSLTPRVYAWTMGISQISPQHLAIFALAAYALSNCLGLLCYPAFAVLHVCGVSGPGVLIALGTVRTLQYATLNQFGDTAVEMALPHWLTTFRGTELLFPGFPFFCCGNTVSDRYCGNVKSVANDRSLSLFLTLIKASLAAAFVLVYVVIRRQTTVNWIVVCALSLCNIVAVFLIYGDSHALLRGIAQEVGSGDGQQVTRGLWQLRGFEVALVMFSLVVFQLPEQAFTTVLAVLVLRTSDTISGIVAGVATLVVFIVLGWAMHAEGKKLRESHAAKQAAGGIEELEGGGQIAAVPEQKRNFGNWASQIIGGTILLAASGTLLMVTKDDTLWLTVLAMALLVPVNAFIQNLHALFEGFLFQYDCERSSDITYWATVLAVVANGPILAVNWVMSTMTENENQELGVVLGVSVALLAVASIYFKCFDPCLGLSWSVTKVVNNPKVEDLPTGVGATAPSDAGGLARQDELAEARDDDSSPMAALGSRFSATIVNGTFTTRDKQGE